MSCFATMGYEQSAQSATLGDVDELFAQVRVQPKQSLII